LGASFAVPLPYFLVHFVPVVNGVRIPGRFAVMTVLALDVLAAVGLSRWARSRRAPVWLVAVVLAAVAVDLLPGHVPVQPAGIPAPYYAIAAESDPGAVLEIPLQWRTGLAAFGDQVPPRDDTVFLYYATAHEHPLVSGMLARYPEARFIRIRNVPLYREVLTLQGDPDGQPPRFGASDLRAAGIGFVVYHRDRPEPEAYRYLSGLALPVLADDGTVLVWRVSFA
jgi:hypothetical protein